jgi:hypothetical protein
MPDAEPPSSIDDLIDNLEARRGLEPDARPPAGPMAQYVTHRFTVEELAAHEENIIVAEDAPHLFELVRAFEVSGVAGGRFTAPSPDQLAPCLERFLCERLPVFEWQVPSVYLGPLWKYLILHDDFPAPPDTATGQPMHLEVAGEIVRIGGLEIGRDFDREEGEPIYLHWSHYYASPVQSGDADIVRPLEIEITAATWANVQSSSANMPWYM